MHICQHRNKVHLIDKTPAMDLFDLKISLFSADMGKLNPRVNYCNFWVMWCS